MPHHDRNRTGRAVARLLAIAVGIAIANALVHAVALPHVELPDLPDIPGWLGFLLRKGKTIVLAVIVVLAAVAEERVRHRGDDSDRGAA